MLTKSSIPQGWRTILADIQRVAPVSIIAGGALRDLIHEVEPKDIDIFVSAGEDTIENRLLEIEWALNTHGYERHRAHVMGYISGGEVTKSVEFRGPEGMIPVNVIVTPAPRLDLDWIERFDFTVCQIAFDGERVFSTHACDADHRAKVFRFTREDDMERSQMRVERIMQRYPDWTIVYPPAYTATLGVE